MPTTKKNMKDEGCVVSPLFIQNFVEIGWDRRIKGSFDRLLMYCYDKVRC